MCTAPSGPDESANQRLKRVLASPIMRAGDFDEAQECLRKPGVDAGDVVTWILRGTRETDEIYRWYRLRDAELIEQDIVSGISSCEALGREDPVYAETALRMVRRFLLGRYSFHRVGFVNDAILSIPGRGRSTIAWLRKDYLLPRVGLSLLVGYGALLGAGSITWWMSEIANRGPLSLLLLMLISECLLIAGLVYLSVRDRIGGSQHKVVWRRTLSVTAGCFVWAAVSVGLQHLICWPMKWSTTWCENALTAVTALLIAVLGQFFFGKSGSGSMAEPL